ncbi:MAG: START domain-containing protein [Proteobacteria bacterium]|nr:START domain-containing protein [Pseudomonadota bacterium]
MKNKHVWSFLSGLALVFFCCTAMASDSWEFVKDDEGISTYSRDVEGSDYKSYKSVTTVTANMAQVGAVFRDILAYTKWMANVSQAKILKKYNANDMDLYFVLNFPWPTSDRDTVLASRTVVDKNTGMVDIHTEDYVDSTVPEKDGLVRIPKLVQIFTMTYLDGNHTEVTYSIHMEAGGSLPVTAVEMDLKKAPFKSLRNLKKIVQEDVYQKADPFDAINSDITKTILSLKLKNYITDVELIELLLQDKTVMEQLIQNGHSEQGRKKNAVVIAKFYVHSPVFASRIQNAKEKDVLSHLATNDKLLNDLTQDDHFIGLILGAGQNGLTESVIQDMVSMITERLNG